MKTPTTRPHTLDDRKLLHGHAMMMLRDRMEYTDEIHCKIALARRNGRPDSGYLLTVYRIDQSAGGFHDDRAVVIPQEIGEQIAAAFLTPAGEWTEGDGNGSH